MNRNLPLKTRFQASQIAEHVFIAPTATVLGEVKIASGSSIWFGAVLRGDTEEIVIGENSNIQDLCLLHADPGFPCRIGNRVTLGHGAIVHGATVADDVLIGIRATVLNGATVGPNCLIAAGALIPEGAIIPPNSVVMGVPGKLVRAATEADHSRIRHAAEHYRYAAEQYLNSCD